MYRVLIADDERLERNAIACALREHLAGQFDIREAENGKIAVETSTQFCPDIIVMDIKMPVMNGIDAAKKIISRFSDCKIIMLTGFTYFNYAKECVSIGAMDFIVKPVADDVVVETLKKAMAAVDVVRQNQQMALRSQEKLCLADSYLESELLVEILFCGLDSDRIKQILSELEVADGWFAVAILFPGAEYGRGGNSQRIEDVCREASRLLEEPGLRVVQCGHYGRVYLLLHTIESKQRSWYTTWLDRFLRHVTAQQQCIAGFGVSQPSRFAAEIPQLVQQAHKAYRKTSAIQFYVESRDENHPLNQNTTEHEMCTLLRERSYTDLLSRLYLAMDDLFANSSEPRGQLYEILMLLNRTAAETVAVEPTYFLYGKLSQMEEPEKVKRYATRFVQDLIDRLIMKEDETGDWWIQVAQEMIHKGYTKEITLEDVARRVGFSTYYFSRLFKQKFEISFVDYLTSLRLQKAKILLRQPSATVKEVSYQVGYSEPNYFTRVFKKETGLTPSAYQKNACISN